MALTSQEQELLDFALGSLPDWFRDDRRQMEFLGGAAKIFGAARTQVEYWFRQALISQADGPVPGLPDWLQQHAIDRGSRRQSGESDAVLAERIRNVPDALNLDAIQDAIDAVLVAAGVVGTAALLELRKDRAFLVVNAPQTGTGGTFGTSGSAKTFTPTAGFARPPYRSATISPVLVHKLVISGAAAGGNNGTFPVTGIVVNGAAYTNAGAVAGADAGVTWRIDRYDAAGNLLTAGAGRHDAYLTRGHRIGSQVATLVVILPFGTDEPTRLAVLEALRQKKAAGVRAIVERRENP